MIRQCNSKFKGDKHCTTPHLTEDDIKVRFVTAFNALMDMKSELIDRAEQIKEMFSDRTEIDAELQRLQQEMVDIADLTQRCIDENARSPMDQAEFNRRYSGYVERFEAAKALADKLELERKAKLSCADRFAEFIRTMETINGGLADFDDNIWLQKLDVAIVYPDGIIVFQFKNGTEIEIEAQNQIEHSWYTLLAVLYLSHVCFYQHT